MALKLSSIRADLARENEGDWVDIPEWPGVRLKVRSINSRDYQNQRELAQQAMIRSLGRLPTSIEMEPKIRKLAAEFLLRGWDGLVGDDEQPIVYTPARAVELLIDPEMRTLAQQVVWAAGRVGEREAEFVEAATKNSAAPSASTLSVGVSPNSSPT